MPTTADHITHNTVSELFNHNYDDDHDPFRDIDTTFRDSSDDKATLSPRAAKRKLDAEEEKFGLGLDEEVKITKKRKPIAKLDEARLLSQSGIPKLRALARSHQPSKKLRLKGKGHEFSDAAKLLNYYQLWLDNLYPRARFADGLQLVEKVGHSKRMQVMRREWIDEGKPGYARDKKPEEDQTKSHDPIEAYRKAGQERSLPLVDNSSGKAATPENSIFGDDFDGDGLLFPEKKTVGSDEGEGLEGDELDALLAAQSSNSKQHKTIPAQSDDEDDLDAFLAEQTMRHNARESPNATQRVSDEDHDSDDLDALQEAGQHASKNAPKHNPFEDESDDDLSTLLPEHKLPHG